MIGLDTRPNVFLAGAPKCGTTSLANWLAEHPECYVTPKKEPHYFGNFLRGNMTLGQYESLFSDAEAKHKVRIDASTSYFTMHDCIKDILKYRPDAKFIVMLRNPVDLAYSWHGECLYLGRESEKSFEKAWMLQEIRRQGKRIPLSCSNPSMLFYRDQALLGKAMENILALAGKDKVHWIFMDDLRSDPSGCYRETLRFLEVDDDGRIDFPVMNRAKGHKYPIINRALRTLGLWRSRLGLPGLGIRSALNRNAKVEMVREPLSDSFGREIYLSFREDINLLENITGRNLSHWAPPIE